jgi:hypothetical protein
MLKAHKSFLILTILVAVVAFYPVRVSGANGCSAQCFSISPRTASVQRGDSTYFTIQSMLPPNKIGTLELTGHLWSVSPPSNVSGLPPGFSSSFVPPTVQGNSTAKLTVFTSKTTQYGYYVLTITLKFDSNAQSLDVQLLVLPRAEEYWVTATPSSLMIPQGSVETSVITVPIFIWTDIVAGPRLNYFVLSTTENGPSVSLPPTTPNLTLQGTANATLTVSAEANVATGNYEVGIIASWSENVTRQILIPVTVVPSHSDFLLSATPVQETVVRGLIPATYNVNVSSPLNSTVTIGIGGGLPPNSKASFAPSSVSPAPGRPASSVLTIATTSSTPFGIYNITITGSSTNPHIVHSIIVTLEVLPSIGTFGLSTGQEGVPLIIHQGQCRNALVSVQAFGSFSSSVSLFVSPTLPYYLTAQFSPDIVTPQLGGKADSNLQICAGPQADLGESNVTIIAYANTQAGTISQSASVVFVISNVPTYVIHVIPIVVDCVAQSSYSIVVESINGFSAPVTLQASGLPTGASPSFSPVTLIPPSNGEANATLTISTSGPLSGPYPPYPVDVVGTSDGTIVSISVPMLPCSVDEFSIVVSPPVVNVSRGSSATATVSMPGLPGMPVGQNITLTGSGNPQGMNLKFSPNALTLQPDTTASSTLTISVDTGVPVGNYTLTISATAGTVQHSANILVRVVSPQCIIATAAYDSDLAGPVQFLRIFRDNEVESTVLGHNFLKAFNPWYYSWAPPVAQTIASNENMKSPVRGLIAPLVFSLIVAHSVFQNIANLNREAAILLVGFFAGALIGAIYLTLPMVVLMWNRKRRARDVYFVVATVGLLLALFGTIMHGSVGLMEVSTSILVVETILLAPTAVARTILRRPVHSYTVYSRNTERKIQ